MAIVLGEKDPSGCYLNESPYHGRPLSDIEHCAASTSCPSGSPSGSILGACRDNGKEI